MQAGAWRQGRQLYKTSRTRAGPHAACHARLRSPLLSPTKDSTEREHRKEAQRRDIQSNGNPPRRSITLAGAPPADAAAAGAAAGAAGGPPRSRRSPSRSGTGAAAAAGVPAPRALAGCEPAALAAPSSDCAEGVWPGGAGRGGTGFRMGWDTGCRAHDVCVRLSGLAPVVPNFQPSRPATLAARELAPRQRGAAAAALPW